MSENDWENGTLTSEYGFHMMKGDIIHGSHKEINIAVCNNTNKCSASNKSVANLSEDSSPWTMTRNNIKLQIMKQTKVNKEATIVVKNKL